MKHFETNLLCICTKIQVGNVVKFFVMYGTAKSQLSNGQCSKTDHILTILPRIMDSAYVSPCIRYDRTNMTLCKHPVRL